LEINYSYAQTNKDCAVCKHRVSCLVVLYYLRVNKPIFLHENVHLNNLGKQDNECPGSWMGVWESAVTLPVGSKVIHLQLSKHISWQQIHNVSRGFDPTICHQKKNRTSLLSFTFPPTSSRKHCASNCQRSGRTWLGCIHIDKLWHTYMTSELTSL